MSHQFLPNEIDRLVRSAWTLKQDGSYSNPNSHTVMEVFYRGNGPLLFKMTPEIKYRHARFLLEHNKMSLSSDEMRSVVAFFEWALAQNEDDSLAQEASKWLTWHKKCEQQQQELDKLLARFNTKSAELR